MSTEEDFVLVPTNITLSEFLAEHLEATKETLKKRTWEGHEETARVHLVPMPFNIIESLKEGDVARPFPVNR
jgi:hypothetical protein